MCESLLMSVATTPQAFPRTFPIPDDLLTSVKVPSPLLWKSQEAIGLYRWGIQYPRLASSPAWQSLLLDLSKSTKRQTNRSSRPSLSQSNHTALDDHPGAATPAFAVTSVKVPSPLLWYRMLLPYWVT